jgi:predicted DNA-binding transcriptional regulator AlpA
MSALTELNTLLLSAREVGGDAILSPDHIDLLIDVLKIVPEQTIASKGPALMTITDVCTELQVTRQTVWRLRKAGEFIDPINLAGRRTMYKRSEFSAWLAAQPRA